MLRVLLRDFKNQTKTLNMKRFTSQTRIALRFASVALVVAFLGFLASCTETKTNKPAPTISLSAATASNIAGSAVTTTVSVSAPEGGKKLAILVNGTANTSLPDVDLAGATAKDVAISFTIPATAGVGSNYVITFQASDNKDQLSLLATFTATVAAIPAKTIVEVTADILADVTWTSDKIYRLNGFIRVGEDKKATQAAGVTPTINKTAKLTIQPGTVILGKKSNGTTPGGALIVQRGSQLIAIGTVDKPIIFTSDAAPGARTPGDWSGVVLCGQSDNNIYGTTKSTSTGTDKIEELEGGYGAYHGGGANVNAADNSGTLKYVRIEYAGYPINPNQELNGLTFGSVGSGTTIDYIQVTYANDDSYEWFGGTVNCKHLIALKGIDDDFDTDNGFSGRVQYGLGIRAASIADQSGSNGFECDNDAGGNSNAPFTTAEFSNMTIIGGKAVSNTTIDVQFQNGAQIRRNAKQKHYNSIITGYPNGIYIDNALPGSSKPNEGTVAWATSGDLVFKNTILAGVENWGGNGFGSASTDAERTAITGLAAGDANYPFKVPQSAGSSTLGDYNHVNNPRGRVVAAGVGAFTNAVFAYTTGELQIGGLAAPIWFGGTGNTNANTLLPKWSSSGLSSNIFDPTAAPTLIPTANSPLLTGGSTTGLNTFFEAVTYRGAFGATDWTTSWTNWNPAITDYSK
jgi:hypothetical protein